MANTIRIKRRVSGDPGAPASLKSAELAYNMADNTVYIGFGDNNGDATSVKPIGGEGTFAKLNSPALTGTPTAPTADASTNTTQLATTAFVKAQNYLTGNQSISVSGDATGSGSTSISLTLANSGVSAGTYTKVTVDAKGRVTTGASIAASDVPTLTAAKISDFDTQVRTSRLDQMAAPTAAVSMNSQKITSLSDPTSATDAATKQYVDNVAQGLDAKQSVRVATTANITLLGLLTIDGVTVSDGDRVLVKNQTASQNNGIYVAASGGWSRAADMDAWSEVPNAFVFVEAGTSQADTSWVVSSNAGGTLGTDAITWFQFGSAASYAAGNGLSLTGNTFAVVGTANRISVSASGVDISSNYVGQNTITTLGTVATGVWNATAIGLAYGGTGGNLSAASDGAIFKKSGTALVAATAGTDYLNDASTVDGGTF